MKKLTVLGIILILAANSASSYIIDNLIITDSLNEDLSIDENIYLSITNNRTQNFTLTLPKNSNNITINNKEHNNKSINIPLDCEKCSLEISYSIDDAIIYKNNHHSFSRRLDIPQKPKVLNYKVTIPKGQIIDSADNTAPIIPQPTNIDTDGKTITITWTETNPDLPKIYYVSYTEGDPEEETGKEITEELKEKEVIILLIMIFALGMFSGIIGEKIRKKKFSNEELPYVPEYLLNPDEKKIINFLSNNKGDINQKNIVKELNWSKSKVSAIMTNLEYKKIVEREKIGRNYKIKLLKNIGK